MTKNYWTQRFPLESHQLRMYIESQIPIDKVVFVADKENSGYNAGLGISGYELIRHDTGIYATEYESNHNDSEIPNAVITSEHVTAIELNRDGFGLYFKCFLALYGTTIWTMLILFICTYHHIDPLNLIPAAFFGTVSNIMIGANLLPDALQLGLLEIDQHDFLSLWDCGHCSSCWDCHCRVYGRGFA